MRKIGKTNELLWLLGLLTVALGVAICSKADLGVSMIVAPAFVLSEALLPLWGGFSVGTVEYLFEGLLLAVMCLAIRRFNWRYLLTFAFAVLYGYTLDFFLWALGGVNFDAVWLRWVMLLVGDTLSAFGVACFFRTYMPLQVYELFVGEVSHFFSFPITKVKRYFDLSLLTASVVLALVIFGDIGTFDWTTVWYASFHNIGLGTLVMTLINSWIIGFFGRVLDRVTDHTPAFPKLENAITVRR